MWVRYDATNKWWEFSTDNINFNRLEENPLIPNYAEFTEVAAPAAPAANKLRLYAKDKAGTSALYLKDDAGAEREVGLAPPSLGFKTELLSYQAGPVGNVGGGTDPLLSFSVPANSLPADGDYLELEGAGTLAANANGKTVTLTYGATTLRTFTSTINNGFWYCKVKIYRKGTNAQQCMTSRLMGTAGAPQSGLDVIVLTTEDLTTALTLAFTCVGVANNDVTQNLFHLTRHYQT